SEILTLGLLLHDSGFLYEVYVWKRAAVHKRDLLSVYLYPAVIDTQSSKTGHDMLDRIYLYSIFTDGSTAGKINHVVYIGNYLRFVLKIDSDKPYTVILRCGI